MRVLPPLLAVVSLLAACGAPGAPVKPAQSTGVTVSGEARIGVTATL